MRATCCYITSGLPLAHRSGVTIGPYAMRRKKIYEGKAKVLFEGPEPGTLVQYFKDDATAFNNKKRGTITGKGVMNNRISEHLMTSLSEMGIPTHLVRRLNMREQLIREVEIIPLEVIVRNVVAGSLATRFGLTAYSDMRILMRLPSWMASGG